MFSNICTSTPPPFRHENKFTDQFYSILLLQYNVYLLCNSNVQSIDHKWYPELGSWFQWWKDLWSWGAQAMLCDILLYCTMACHRKIGFLYPPLCLSNEIGYWQLCNFPLNLKRLVIYTPVRIARTTAYILSSTFLTIATPNKTVDNLLMSKMGVSQFPCCDEFDSAGEDHVAKAYYQTHMHTMGLIW